MLRNFLAIFYQIRNFLKYSFCIRYGKISSCQSVNIIYCLDHYLLAE